MTHPALTQSPVRPWYQERRSPDRYAVRVNVGILSADGQTKGTVRDMSVMGARIEGARLVPRPGEKLRLGFSFYARALPIPLGARVVRHTETGGFAVRFEDVDFRTRILLEALLPKYGDGGSESERVGVGETGQLDLDLGPVLLACCQKAAELRGISLEKWILQTLERCATQALGY